MSRYNPPRPMPLPGWVYVLMCPSFPGCCKIGGTGRTATHRAAELAGEYASGQPFSIGFRIPVSDWPAAEAAAHRMLSDRRVPRSELFRCSPREARAVVKAAAGAQRRPWLAWLRRSPRKTQRRTWRRYRRNDSGAGIVLGVLAVALLIAWIKPPVPSWLPPSSARALVWLERLQPPLAPFSR